MHGEPFLRHYTPFLKILFLVLIILLTLLFTLLIGIVLSLVFFGPGIMDDLLQLSGETLLSNIPLQKYLQIISQFGTFILPALLFSWLVNRNVPAYLKLDRSPRLSVLFLSFAAILVILPCVNWLMEINEQLHLPGFLSGVEQWMRSSEDQAQQLMEAFMSDTSIRGLLVNLFMVGILAALGEELIFRGIAIRLLDEWFNNKHLAVWIAAVVFSAFHLQFYGFLPRTVLGVLLGYLFVYSGSLWIPIIVHLLNNSLGVVIMYLHNRGIIATDLEEFGSTSNPFLIIISLLLSALLVFEVYRRQKKTPREMDS